VNVDNFIRAETNMQSARLQAGAGGINQLMHYRSPPAIDKQLVIRMNRDTLYSGGVIDISQGATITLPDAGERYITMMVINQDHYINKVFSGAGTYELTMKEFGTPYVYVAMRTLVDSADPDDIKAVNVLQDKMSINAKSAKAFVLPNYDIESYQATHSALLALTRGTDDFSGAFGKKSAINPVRHLLGTASGFGGLPEHEAIYLNVDPSLPVGEYSLTVKDVPVDAFWSISLYNKEGYYQLNDRNAYSINSVTGVTNKDGSYTVNFGGCTDAIINCLDIMEGWNYIVRLYQPQQAILNNTWHFPLTKSR